MKTWLISFLPNCYCHCALCTHFADVRWPTKYQQACSTCLVAGCAKEFENTTQFIMTKRYKARCAIANIVNYLVAKWIYPKR